MSLTMQSVDGQPLRPALPGQYLVLRLQPRLQAARSPLLKLRRPRRCFAATRWAPHRRTLSNQREDRAERGCWNLPGGACPGGREPRRQLAPEASFCSQESGRSCCSAQESGRRRFWRCCMRWPWPVRRDRCCGSTRRRSAAPSVRRRDRQLLLALTHGRSYVCYSRPGSPQDARGFRRRRSPVALSVRSGRRPTGGRRLPGPTRFMAETEDALATFGVAPARIHVEVFQRQRVDDPWCRRRSGASATCAQPRLRSRPVVSFARSGIAAHWKASAYQSILELAEACDVPVRWSCRAGVCHNCESGTDFRAVVYGPEPLDKPAEGNLLVCCSQPTRDVVIDL